MANRIYLYTTDFEGSIRNRERTDTVIGLSSNNSCIPLSYKILVSQGVKKCNSIIWDNDQKIALIGNSDKGKIELIRFLDNLISKRLFDETILTKKIEEAKIVLADNLDFILLEAGEVFDMEEGELEMHNNKLFNEISRIDNVISKFYKEVMDINTKLDKLRETLSDVKSSDDFIGKMLFKLFSKNKIPLNDVILKCERAIYNLENHKWNLLGIDYWSKALYHSFENNAHPKKIMQNILWSFNSKSYQSKEEFIKDLVQYNEKIRGEEFTVDLESKVLNSTKVVIKYMYFDDDGEEIESDFVLEADNNRFFTKEELLYKVHNMVCKKLEDQDDVYFEGFMFGKREHPNYPDLPLYFLLQGS